MDRGSPSERDRLRDLEERVAALERRLDGAPTTIEDSDDEALEATPPRQLPDAVEGMEATAAAPGEAAPPAEGY